MKSQLLFSGTIRTSDLCNAVKMLQINDMYMLTSAHIEDSSKSTHKSVWSVRHHWTISTDAVVKKWAGSGLLRAIEKRKRANHLSGRNSSCIFLNALDILWSSSFKLSIAPKEASHSFECGAPPDWHGNATHVLVRRKDMKPLNSWASDRIHNDSWNSRGSAIQVFPGTSDAPKVVQHGNIEYSLQRDSA